MTQDVGSFHLATLGHALSRRDIAITAVPMPMARQTSGAGDEAAYLDALAKVLARGEIQATISLGSTSGQRPLWLDEIYSLIAHSRPDAAVDILFNRFDDLFSRSEFERCDEVLRAIDLGRLDTNLLVAVLSITRPARDSLSAREEIVRSVERELQRRVPARAERLLRGLR